jgi:hypothetical protein
MCYPYTHEKCAFDTQRGVLFGHKWHIILHLIRTISFNPIFAKTINYAAKNRFYLY